MADFAPFNLGQALQSGTQAAVSQATLQELMQKSKRRKELQGLLPQVAQGNLEAAGKAVAIDPEATTQFMTAYGKLDEQKRAQAKQKLQGSAKLAIQVMQAPEPLRPQIYAQARQQAQQLGVDVANLPEQYTPDMGARLQTFVTQASELSDLMKQKEYSIEEIGIGEKRQKAYVSKTPGTEPIPIGDPYAKTPATQVNIGSEKAEAEAFGKELVKQYGSVAERATAAEDAITQLRMAKSIDVTTGAVEPLKASVAAYAESLGFDPTKVGLDRATNAQAFTGIMQNLVLTKMQAQKGPQTENDAKRIEATLANLKNTPEARDFMIDAAMALEERNIEHRDFIEQFRSDKGTLNGATKAWNEFKNKTPLLGKNPNTGRPVFFNQFRQVMREANPGATDEQILSMWRTKYGRAN